jgi:hypothetical protein
MMATLTLVFDDGTVVVLSAGFPVGRHCYLKSIGGVQVDVERKVGDSGYKIFGLLCSLYAPVKIPRNRHHLLDQSMLFSCHNQEMDDPAKCWSIRELSM